jgi:folate-binding protein YgfZ
MADEVDVDMQLRAAHTVALVVPEAELGTLVVTGRDRASWLNGLVTCDVAKLREGQARLGLAAAKNGKVQAELRLIAAPDRVLVGLARDRVARIHETFDKHLIMEDAEIVGASDAYAWVSVHGPHADELAAIARANGALAASLDVTGLGGAVIASPAFAYGAVLDALRAHAGVVVGDCAGWERLRVERFVPRFGVDYDDQSYPQEASIERLAVSFDKGCYLGQETICMLELRGHVKKKLVQLAVDAAPESVPAGAPIALADCTEIGKATSVGPSDHAGEALALGYVKYKHAAKGALLTVAGHAAKIAHIAAGGAD